MEVPSATVDGLAADWERVDLVKVDVEGVEDAVWRGMRSCLDRSPGIHVIMEFNNHRLADPRGFLEEVTGAGFRLRCIETDSTTRELTVDQCLTERVEWMLSLRRA